MTTDEEFRHQCEVRQLLRWQVERGSEFVRQWLLDIRDKRGEDAYRRIRDDCKTQWELGNRGEHPMWLTKGDGNAQGT